MVVGLEPEWNYQFEVDGISYNRYAPTLHQGQQMICDLKPITHYASTCSLCSPNRPMTDIPADSMVIRWDQVQADHILLDGMTTEQKAAFVANRTVPIQRVSCETESIATSLLGVMRNATQSVKNYKEIVKAKIVSVVRIDGNSALINAKISYKKHQICP